MEAMPPIVPFWRRQHWRFYGYLLGLMGLLMLASLPIGLLLAVYAASFMGGEDARQPSQALIAMVVLFVIPLFYLVVRLSFVFPAVSVDESYRFVHAWRHSRGQGWRLAGAIVVTLLPVGLLSGLTTLAVSFAYFGDTRLITGEGLVDDSGNVVAGAQSAMLVDAVVTQPLGYIMTALFVTVLSFAFRVSTGWIPPNEGTVGPALETEDRE
jgi:membrane-anchored glycerophosphoryl diester phosphodiesterase (GDPDase)